MRTSKEAAAAAVRTRPAQQPQAGAWPATRPTCVHQVKPVHEGARPGGTDAQQRPTLTGFVACLVFLVGIDSGTDAACHADRLATTLQALKLRSCGARASGSSTLKSASASSALHQMCYNAELNACA